ncbi:MAG: hypothetical protein MUE81_14045 [Thermoflexibacter sp.]|jgi:hypothetical protein|nr:hypothetical protein [Thermoflexibacter sp.]
MFVAFDQLPNHTRIWIYQSDRLLTSVEVAKIDLALRNFTQHWEAHQTPLQSSYQILYNRFIILAVNEDYHQASGCSIDKSVAVVRQIEQEFAIKLFDRLTLAYWENGEVKTIKNKELKEKIGNGEFLPTTLVFNNIVQTKGEMLKNWQVPILETYLAKYFKKELAI